MIFMYFFNDSEAVREHRKVRAPTHAPQDEISQHLQESPPVRLLVPLNGVGAPTQE